ncbi:hypothetical protein [Bowmanella dokdonensis]|nr:hypothetical protein [Bowmanella dokdonensis]
MTLVASFAMVGCTQEEKSEGVGKYGMMDSGTPEYAAIQFFDHLYHDSNLEEVLRFSSPKMGRLIRSYQTSRNFQRHVLNLSYDKVELVIDSGNNRMRSEFSDKATVTVFFTGTLHGEKHEDLRTVNLVKADGDWKVDEIEADKFL